jgi:phage tail protein X
MTEAAETITVKADGLVLDLLLWRRHGIAGQALIEEALDSNPGLAALGVTIPPGTTIVLPALPAASPTAIAIDLFG